MRSVVVLGRFSVCISISLLGLANCGQNADEDAFAEAEQMVLEQNWEEAGPKLKEFLLQNPEHAGGHFYLGRCYLNGEDFQPYLAEGEIRTALHIFLRTGRTSPIERFPDDYFEFMCHIESAKVALNTIRLLTDEGVPFSQMGGLVARMKEHSAEAGKIKPKSEDLRELNAIISSLERGMLSTPSRPARREGQPVSI